MASYQNYQTEDKKNKNMISASKTRPNRRKNLENMNKKDRFHSGLHLWIGYFRANPHRFVKEYIQFKPFSTFQAILLFMMFQSHYFLFWASRGQLML